MQNQHRADSGGRPVFLACLTEERRVESIDAEYSLGRRMMFRRRSFIALLALLVLPLPRASALIPIADKPIESLLLRADNVATGVISSVKEAQFSSAGGMVTVTRYVLTPAQT